MKFSCYHLLIFPLIIIFLSPGFVSAQSIKLSDKLNFSVNNVPVSDALEALTRVSGNTFSYNPDQVSANRLVRVDLHNRPLIEVLNAILGAPGYGYRQMGNQIIIYRNKEDNNTVTEQPEMSTKPKAEKPKDNIISSEIARSMPVKPDTVIKEVRDTIKLTEYVIKHDTIYEKVITPVSGNEIFSKTADLSEELTPVWKYTIGVNVSYYLPSSAYTASSVYSEKLNEYKDSYSNSVFSGSAGFNLSASYNRLSATTGLGLTIFSEKLDYSYLKETGGFYRKDTLDSYYTLTQGDTTWYYILDSAYVPKDNELYNYKINNHFKYAEIPLTVQYSVPLGKNLVFGRAGLIAGILVGADGQQIKVEEDGIIPVVDLSAKSIVFSYTIGAGLDIPINRRFILTSSLSWRSHLNSIYTDFPIDIRYRALGINLAFRYKIY